MISKRINSIKSATFFIDGPRGMRKTFLYRTLLANVRSKGFLDLATTTLGIVASILPCGRTPHSLIKIPIDFSKDTICRFSRQTSLAIMIREAKFIIWAEVSMCKKIAIET